MSPNVHQDCQGRQVKPGDFLTDSFITLQVVSLHGSGQFVYVDEAGALVTNFCCCFTVCPPPAHEGLGDSLAAPAEAGQEVRTQSRPCPREKLKVLRAEFAEKAAASLAADQVGTDADALPFQRPFELAIQQSRPVAAPALRFKRKTAREDLQPERQLGFGSRGINARFTVQIPVTYPLLDGDQVVGVLDVRIHALDALQGDERQFVVQALQLAADRMRSEIKAGR